MTNNFGHNVLAAFDVWEDTKEFLANTVTSCSAPTAEARELFNRSLLGVAEDWNNMIDCARSLQRESSHGDGELEGADVLTHIWYMLDGFQLGPSPDIPWIETDRLIEVARGLAIDPEIQPPSLLVSPAPASSGAVRKATFKKTRILATSHYFADPIPIPEDTKEEGQRLDSLTGALLAKHMGSSSWSRLSQRDAGSKVRFHSDLQQASKPTLCYGGNAQGESCCGLGASREKATSKLSSVSPYFAAAESVTQTSPTKKAAGTISCIPFPALTSPYFGLIQEKLAHEPFWLLIAVTFLIKTAGSVAIPAFYKVKERFPMPSDLANSDNAEELLSMIRHLGLYAVRLAYIQKYSVGFLERPPKAGLRYRVNGYDRRDCDPSGRVLNDDTEERPGLLTPGSDCEDMDAWEIGHMTKGKYALDSWRIFCRDELLGRASDWNGKDQPELQPEWMRVMPHDKELRAYLRWMWMREGWEWDPITGEKEVLRDEMRRAVNEGRVEYDDAGGLRILDQPRA